MAALRSLVLSTYPAVCRLCRQPIDTTLPPSHPMGLSVGHVVPRSRGGTDDLANLRPEHLSCNVSLGARPVPGRRPRLVAGFFDDAPQDFASQAVAGLPSTAKSHATPDTGPAGPPFS